MSLNKAMIIGNLGSDVELRYTQGGKAVATLSVATTDRRKDQNGDFQEVTEWHRCNVWDKMAENCAKYLKKGSKIFVEGKIGTRKWEDKNGVERYSTEITASTVDFLDSKPSGNNQAQAQQWQAQPQTQTPAPSQGGPSLDDIPF